MDDRVDGAVRALPAARLELAEQQKVRVTRGPASASASADADTDAGASADAIASTSANADASANASPSASESDARQTGRVTRASPCRRRRRRRGRSGGWPRSCSPSPRAPTRGWPRCTPTPLHTTLLVLFFLVLYAYMRRGADRGAGGNAVRRRSLPRLRLHTTVHTALLVIFYSIKCGASLWGHQKAARREGAGRGAPQGRDGLFGLQTQLDEVAHRRPLGPSHIHTCTPMPRMI